MQSFSPWIFLFFFLSNIQKGSSFETPARYITKYIGTNDGLPSRKITGITQDKSGIIWIGTQDIGLVRFDGNKFTTHFQDNSIPIVNINQEVLDLVTDKNGDILIATMDGILVFDPKIGIKNKIFRDHKITVLYKDFDQNIWVSYNGKIFLSVKGEINQFKLISMNPAEISSITMDNHKRIWIIDIDGKCKFLENQHDTQLSNGIYLINKIPLNWSQQILNLKGEILGMNYFDIENQRFPIQFTKEGHFLPGFPEHGIPIFEIIKSTNFPSKEFLKFGKGEIKYFRDKLGIIWISTGYGIIQIKEKSVQFNNLKALEGISARGMLEKENGNVIITTYNGIYEWNKNSKKGVKLPYNLLNKNICFKPIHLRGDLLFTTVEDKNGFCILDLKNNSFINYDNLILKSSGVGYRGAFYDKKRDVILTGNNKIYLINPKNLDLKPLPFEHPNKNIQLFDFQIRDSSSYYIGTDYGLLLFDLHKGWLPNNFTINNLDLDISLRINHIFKSNNGYLWLSTNQKGIFLYDPKTNKVLKSFNTKDGLPSNEVYAINSTDDGKTLWLSTANGISIIKNENNIIHNFNVNDGLPGNEFNCISHLKTKNGLIFFGGTEGVTYFNPLEINATFTIKPNPFISDVKIFDSKEGVEKILNIEKPITIEWYQSPINIYLGGDDYFNFDNQIFRYKLIGYDETWQYKKGRNPIQYSKLPQGKYTLNVQMRSNYSDWNSKGISLNIIQKPIWYKQTFFIFLIQIIVILIIYLVISLKLKQIEKEQNVRLEIAEDLHDRMGSMIFAINFGANNLLQSKIEIHENIKNELNHIINECQRINLAISDIIWAIDLGRQKFKDLITRFHDYSDKYLLEKGIKVIFQISDKIPIDRNLSLTLRHQLMMIFTEAIQNILKHAPDSFVTINIKYEKGILFIEIKNCYKEKTLTKFSSGYGIDIMKKRARRIKASIHFENNENCFEIFLKVKV